MEHTFAATAAMLILVFLAVIGLFLLTGSFEAEEEVLAAENSASASETEPPEMCLGIFEGKLALFIGESPYPNVIYDFFARTLPEEDRIRLAEGIKISSEEELEALLEDYMS